MAQTQPQANLVDALLLPDLKAGETRLTLSDHVGFGNTSHGGYIAAILTKAAVSYASQHRRLSNQQDVRSSSTMFFRPVFPSRGAVSIRVREVHVGKTWSMLQAELSQADQTKICASAECIMTNFTLPGIDLDTKWTLRPPPPPVDLSRLEAEDNKYTDWLVHHVAFHPNGFRRGHSYVKFFVPSTWSPTSSLVEHWILPGWDCSPEGSRHPSKSEARFTTDMLPFVLDMNLPTQESFFPSRKAGLLPIASVLSTTEFALEQLEARRSGKLNWRAVGEGSRGDGSRPDGFKAFMARGNVVSVTIGMTVEVKRRLPEEGVRWLYLRGEVKDVQGGRQDLQVLCFDQDMNLVAIRTGVEQLLDPTSKIQRPNKSEGTAKPRI